MVADRDGGDDGSGDPGVGVGAGIGYDFLYWLKSAGSAGAAPAAGGLPPVLAVANHPTSCITPEREPYRVREGGSRLCFVNDPDGYRIELIDRSGK